MRIALHKHQFAHLNGAILAHAAQIVASQVNQHHVLGALFFVGQQFGFELLVFGFIGAARLRSRNGTVAQLALFHPHQHLGRGTKNSPLAHAQKVHIR